MLNFQMKTVRGRVVEKHSRIMDYLYTPAGKNIQNELNTLAMKMLLNS
jgi:hypothetical protein